MLPLPIFDYHRPRTLDRGARPPRRSSVRARGIIAGGTDVLPNMKQGLFEPEHLVSVARCKSCVASHSHGLRGSETLLTSAPG